MEQGKLEGDLIQLRAEFRGFKEEMREKHLQNRKDIHAIRDSMQTFSDRLYLKVDEVKKVIDEVRDEMAEKIVAIQISAAKQTAWWAGVAAACVLFARIIELAVQHYWK